eukprot:gene23786-9346_t
MADLQPDPLGGGANNHSNSVFAAEDDHQPGDDISSHLHPRHFYHIPCTAKCPWHFNAVLAEEDSTYNTFNTKLDSTYSTHSTYKDGTYNTYNAKLDSTYNTYSTNSTYKDSTYNTYYTKLQQYVILSYQTFNTASCPWHCNAVFTAGEDHQPGDDVSKKPTRLHCTSPSVFAAEDDHQPGDDVAKKPTRPWCTSPSGETALHHKSSLFRQALTPLSELYPAMLSLLSLKKVKQLANCLSEAVVDRLSEMINHGIKPESMACLLLGTLSPEGEPGGVSGRGACVDRLIEMINHSIKPESMACLLLGTLSPEGYELKQYRSLAGILAKRYKQTVENIGGPITAALAAAGMTTKDRLEQLESQLLEQHR